MPPSPLCNTSVKAEKSIAKKYSLKLASKLNPTTKAIYVIEVANIIYQLIEFQFSESDKYDIKAIEREIDFSLFPLLTYIHKIKSQSLLII